MVCGPPASLPMGPGAIHRHLIAVPTGATWARNPLPATGLGPRCGCDLDNNYKPANFKCGCKEAPGDPMASSLITMRWAGGR